LRRDPGNRAARDSFTLNTSRAVDALHPRKCEKRAHIPSMPYSDPDPYRWQDHVVTPRRAAAGLLATALVILFVGAAAILAGPSPDQAAPAAVTERAPPSPQQAKGPVRPRVNGHLL
jgi:hypothetical protein